MIVTLGAAQPVAQSQPTSELTHLVALTSPDEGHPNTTLTSAPRPPNAVDVRLMIGRGIEVDHVRDPVDIDPSGGEVGGDKRVDPATLEAGQSPVSLTLGLVTVNRYRVQPVGVKPLDEAIRAALGADEHDRPVALAVQLLDQGREAMLVTHGDEAVLHPVGFIPPGLSMFVGDRPRRVAARQLAGDTLERSREEQRLAP